METVAELLRAYVGAPAIPERTGGGCGSYVVRLDDGGSLVVNVDAMLPSWGDLGVSVGVFRPGDWTDENQPPPAAHVWDDTESPLTPDLLRTLVDLALSGYGLARSTGAVTVNVDASAAR